MLLFILPVNHVTMTAAEKSLRLTTSDAGAMSNSEMSTAVRHGSGRSGTWEIFKPCAVVGSLSPVSLSVRKLYHQLIRIRYLGVLNLLSLWATLSGKDERHAWVTKKSVGQKLSVNNLTHSY